MASVTVRGRFEEGKRVGLYTGGDFFRPPGGAKPVKTAVVRDGEATFNGLPEGARYFAAQLVDGEWRHAAVTAKEPSATKQRQSEEEIRDTLSGTLPAHNVGSGVITGPRSTGNATPENPTAAQRAEAVIEQSGIPAAHEPTEGGPPQEPHPRIKQADVPEGTQQRSDTPMGEGHPVDVDEPQPRVPQSDVPKGTPQMSDTPLGEATPIDPKAVQPGTRQEDVPEGTQQRSDTPTGTAEPLPKVGPVKSAKRRSSSRSKARGATKGQAARKSPKRPARKAAAKKGAKKPAAKRSTSTRSRSRGRSK